METEVTHVHPVKVISVIVMSDEGPFKPLTENDPEPEAKVTGCVRPVWVGFVVLYVTV